MKKNNRYNYVTQVKKRERREDNGEKKIIRLREEVNELYFKFKISKNMIAKKKKVSKDFVIKWTKMKGQDFTKDDRGWKRGRGRRWNNSVRTRVKEMHEYLKKDPYEFYTGATAISQEWRKRYPKEEVPPLRTLGKMLSDLGLSEKKEGKKNKGAARYLCYPEHTIYNLFGGRVLEGDFIGKKYIRGRTEPINFIGFSFKKDPRLKYFKRIEGQTAKEFIRVSGEFFTRFEKPNYIKTDNSLAMIGSASGKRNISTAMRYLLANEVIPIFSVPRKPFSQASIEGNNSVFSRKFWNRYEFENMEEIDEKLRRFNEASQRYTGYEKEGKQIEKKNNFRPKIYFIRQVREDEEEKGRGYIDILNERVNLNSSYVNYFVLAEWDLRREKLRIYIERNLRSKKIKEEFFEINQRSRRYLKGLVDNVI